jgi:hypothetical protein
MANKDFYTKTKPCTPPVLLGATLALDGTTGLWKGNALDTSVDAITAAGQYAYTLAEVTRFKYDFDNVALKVTALAAAQIAADAAALALSTDLANGPKITTMQTTSAAVAAAVDTLAAARAALLVPINGKLNPYA